MYFPYFRGKQYELIVIRENSERIAANSIIPILEPVKKNLSPLIKAIQSLQEKNAQFILIVNPKCGELVNDEVTLLHEVVDPHCDGYEYLILGYIVNEQTEINDVIDFLDSRPRFNICIIHDGYPKGKVLAGAIQGYGNIKWHVFVEVNSGKLYRNNFKDHQRVLIRDGFKKRNNREHPPSEHFSDLHITYVEENMNGFGDYLIAGGGYLEGGGPAYAVAIHMTYLDDETDMFIKHYVSDSNTSPVNPGGKFLEAVIKLVNDFESDSSLFKSEAYQEYKKLHDEKHYPGLGYVKKLSMQHHIELIINFNTDNE